jgi:hypothetical protein
MIEQAFPSSMVAIVKAVAALLVDGPRPTKDLYIGPVVVDGENVRIPKRVYFLELEPRSLSGYPRVI